MSRLVVPSRLPLAHRRVIANELVVALKNRRWVKHERVYGDPPGFQTLGAHQDPSPQNNREIVERYLSFVVDANNSIDLPAYAVMIPESVYEKARDDLSRDGLLHSLDFVLKARAANPYRIDTDRGRYRVRRALAEQTLTDPQDEALLALVNYLAIHDIASALLAQFYDDVAAREDYAQIVAMAEKLRQQIGD